MGSIRNEFRWKMVKRKKQVINCCMALGFVLFFVSPSSSFAADAVSAKALPTDPVTIEGSTSHSYTDSSLNVDMHSSFVREAYGSFNIGRDAQVNISGGNTYVAKVLNGGGLSHIYGQLNATGINVFLQNSSGITFHDSSQINVGSLLATTARNIDFNDEQASLYSFADASIINDGNIKVSNGGFAILAAPYVENNGFIQADLGRIVLSSTTAMTIDLRGDGLITYGVTDDSLSKVGVKNTGILQARSGVINISANAASDIVDSVVNLEGVIDADSFGEGRDGGTVIISSAGDINMDDVTISADGGLNGNGGEVKTFAGGVNNFSADAFINVSGGQESGNGGFVDISGEHISFNGNINATAANGDGGTLLIDPETLKIRNGINPGSDESDSLLDIVYEKAIEFFSGLGVNVVLEADKNIILENLDDDVLNVGLGGIILRTLDADGAISFDDKSDTISSTLGDIVLYAGNGGIDIGGLSSRSFKIGDYYLGSPGEIILTSKGDISTKSISVTGKTMLGGNISGLIYANAEGSVLIDGNVSVDASSIHSGIVDVSVNVSGEDGVIVNGDIIVVSSSENGDASSSVNLNAGGVDSNIDVVGGISSIANSIFQQASADITITATGDMLLSGVNEPLAQANGALLQQRIAGTDSAATGDATLNITAGGNVRFFDANNFDQNGIHKETGTPYNPAGYDINGYDANGFDINGFDVNGYDINGYDVNGFDVNGYDINGYDVDGFDVNGFDVSGYDINGYDADGFDINGFNLSGIHRDTGTVFNPEGFDIGGGAFPEVLNLLVSKLNGSNDNDESRSPSDSGLGNLEPASGGDDCEFMNCEE